MPTREQLQQHRRPLLNRLKNKLRRMITRIDAEFIDWSEHGILPPIRNQKPNNTCVSYAVSVAIEAAYKLYFDEDIELCPEWMHKVLLQAESLEASTFLGTLYDKLEERRNNEIRLPLRENVTGSYDEYSELVPPQGIITPQVELSDNIRLSLQNGPVAVNMEIGTNFEAWSGDGIYDGDTIVTSNHVICIIGYNWLERYWIAQNSYGDDWGDNGKIKIKIGTCDIENRWSLAVTPNEIVAQNPLGAFV